MKALSCGEAGREKLGYCIQMNQEVAEALGAENLDDLDGRKSGC